MGDRSKGLIGKFTVTRNDGSSAQGEKHCHCRYYVLDLDHDPHAKPALAAYAKSARADGFTALADDLDKIVELWGPSQYFETENLGATVAELKMREQSVGAGSTGAPEQEKLAKIGARVLQMIDLSHDCSEALLNDVVQDVVMRGTIAREEHKKRAFVLGDFRPREG